MRDTSLENLHPVFRDLAVQVEEKLNAESIPFKIFEGFRSPKRQAHLYAQGRTRSGRIVTRAKPWSSYHQYGVAADFVLYIDGRWSWNDRGENAAYWKRLHKVAMNFGLKALSFEKPHLQLASVTLQQLHGGDYPEQGDESWATNLTEAIYDWSGHPSPPPLPQVIQERPPLDDEVDCLEIATELPQNRTRWRVNARSGLRLRSGPGTEFDVIDTLRPGQVVYFSSRHEEWFQVDLEGDGFVDGFCHGAYLTELDSQHF